jgi:hypothetical protein
MILSASTSQGFLLSLEHGKRNEIGIMDDIIPAWIFWTILSLLFAGGLLLLFYFLDWISNRKEKK